MAQGYIYDDGWRHIVAGDLPAISPSGAAGGDLAGSYPNPTVGDVSLLTAKGDLLVRPAAAPATRLAVGADGTVLTADTASAGGVKWAAGGGGSPTGAAGGSLAGTYPNPTIAASGVTAATYGDSTHVAQVTVAADGRVTAASSVAISGVPGGAWTTVSKPGDTSVTSQTTPQADPDLLFASVVGAVYRFEFFLVYGSPAGAGTPDLLLQIAEDGTSRGQWIATNYLNTADTAVTVIGAAKNVITGVGGQGAFGTAAANRVAYVYGWYLGNGGTFQLSWSQNTSNANATILRTGSYLSYLRVV